jgi:DNA-binding IscR family transcriptional regulator
MNYRDERILEWLNQNGSVQLKYHEVADKYNCSLITAKRIFGKFKSSGLIEIENCKRGGIRVTIKDDSCPKN